MDQLRKALASALGADAPPEPESPAPVLGDPADSAWAALLIELGGEVVRGHTLGQLTQRSAARVRALEAAGSRREARALEAAQQTYLRDRERRAWALVKARFEQMELSDKAYRSVKQDGVDPERVLARLNSRRGHELRGAGAARVRDLLTK